MNKRQGNPTNSNFILNLFEEYKRESNEEEKHKKERALLAKIQEAKTLGYDSIFINALENDEFNKWINTWVAKHKEDKFASKQIEQFLHSNSIPYAFGEYHNSKKEDKTSQETILIAVLNKYLNSKSPKLFHKFLEEDKNFEAWVNNNKEHVIIKKLLNLHYEAEPHMASQDTTPPVSKITPTVSKKHLMNVFNFMAWFKNVTDNQKKRLEKQIDESIDTRSTTANNFIFEYEQVGLDKKFAKEMRNQIKADAKSLKKNWKDLAQKQKDLRINDANLKIKVENAIEPYEAQIKIHIASLPQEKQKSIAYKQLSRLHEKAQTELAKNLLYVARILTPPRPHHRKNWDTSPKRTLGMTKEKAESYEAQRTRYKANYPKSELQEKLDRLNERIQALQSAIREMFDLKALLPNENLCPFPPDTSALNRFIEVQKLLYEILPDIISSKKENAQVMDFLRNNVLTLLNNQKNLVTAKSEIIDQLKPNSTIKIPPTPSV